MKSGGNRQVARSRRDGAISRKHLNTPQLSRSHSPAVPPDPFRDRPNSAPENDRDHLGSLLKSERVKHGLRQSDVAKKTGLSTGTVQAIEHNKWRVHDHNVEKYAAAIGTTTHQLLHPHESLIKSSVNHLLADLVHQLVQELLRDPAFQKEMRELIRAAVRPRRIAT